MSLDELIAKYSPIVYFHSHELYFPCSIEYILQNSDLYVTNVKTLTQPSILNLWNYSQTLYPGQSAVDGFYVNISPNIIYGQTQDVVSIYATVYETKDFIYISYSALFAFNGPKMVLGLFPAESHYGDIERLTVEVSKATGELTRAFYGAHRDVEGRWVNKEDLPMENGRIVVYSAKYSHAFYPQSGTVLRIYGFGNDLTNKGYRWQPPVKRVYKLSDPQFSPNKDGWAYFAGRIGKDGITSLSDKVYFNSTEEMVTKSPPIIDVHLPF